MSKVIPQNDKKEKMVSFDDESLEFLQKYELGLPDVDSTWIEKCNKIGKEKLRTIAKSLNFYKDFNDQHLVREMSLKDQSDDTRHQFLNLLHTGENTSLIAPKTPWRDKEQLRQIKHEQISDDTTKLYGQIDALFKKLEKNEKLKVDRVIHGKHQPEIEKKFRRTDRYTLNTMTGNAKEIRELYHNSLYDPNMERINHDSAVWSHYSIINKNQNKKFNFYASTNASKSTNSSALLGIEDITDSRRIKNDKKLKLGKEQHNMLKIIKGAIELGAEKETMAIPYDRTRQICG